MIAESYIKPMSASISPDGSCNFKKDSTGVYMKGPAYDLKQFFYAVNPHLDISSPSILGTFIGETTFVTVAMPFTDFGDVTTYCKDQFIFDAHGNFNTHGNYDHQFVDQNSEWIKKDSGTYTINGHTINAGNHKLQIQTNGSLKWG